MTAYDKHELSEIDKTYREERVPCSLILSLDGEDQSQMMVVRQDIPIARSTLPLSIVVCGNGMSRTQKKSEGGDCASNSAICTCFPVKMIAWMFSLISIKQCVNAHLEQHSVCGSKYGQIHFLNQSEQRVEDVFHLSSALPPFRER